LFRRVKRELPELGAAPATPVTERRIEVNVVSIVRRIRLIAATGIVAVAALGIAACVEGAAWRKPVPEPGHRSPVGSEVVADVRIVSVRQVGSSDTFYPYALEVVIQTDEPVQPVAFVLECDDGIGRGSAVIRSGGVYKLYTRTKQGIPNNHPDWCFRVGNACVHRG
jgi:hypothetical protein